jgi:hypothetical protein
MARPSKKKLIRELNEKTDLFNASKERQNIENLELDNNIMAFILKKNLYSQLINFLEKEQKE